MDLALSSLIFSVTIIVSFASVSATQQQGGTCNACNCQFDNVEVLTQLIKSEVAAAGKLSLLLRNFDDLFALILLDIPSHVAAETPHQTRVNVLWLILSNYQNPKSI